MESLYFFAKGVLGFDWLTPEIHKPLCDKLQDQGLKRQRLVLPRGWLKSTMASVALPIWEAINNPNVRILIVQNTHTNACKKLAAIRACVEECGLFRMLWPELLPDKNCVWKTDALCLKRAKSNPESTFEAAGTRTKVVSRHYDVIVEDDTVAPDLDDLTETNFAPTKEDVDQAIGWHRLVPPLLVNPKTSRNIIVGTRWFVHDLLSWNQEHEPQFEGLTRACREDEKGVPDENGAVTYPERFDDEVLAELRNSLGPYMYSCLYMNKPVRSEDMLFHPNWFIYYEHESSPIITYTTVDLGGDPALTKGEPDYNVVMTCGKNVETGVVYVLDFWRKKANPGETIEAIFAHQARFHPVKVLVEGVGYQKNIVHWIRERMVAMSNYFNVEIVPQSRVAKETRIQQLQPMIEMGMIQFRRRHQELITEILAFPLGKNDDLPDALAMQIPLWAQTRAKHQQEVVRETEGVPLEEAIDEIRTRHRLRDTRNTHIFDVYNTHPALN